MKSFNLYFSILLLFFAIGVPVPDLCAQNLDTTSYSIGLSLGKRLKNQGAGELNYESLVRGLSDALEGKEELLSRQTSDSLNAIYFQIQRDRMFDKVKNEGIAFLEKNATRSEVKTTASGLQYEVLQEGSGAKPGARSRVTVHYEGRLLNGDIFDSSYLRNEPASFPLYQVISGWTEGLQLMSVGSKYRLYLPNELAYGSRGAGADIPPYSALIFDVELLSFD